MTPDDEISLGLANLHDAFINCSLLKKLMESCPIETDITKFMISDRGRAERLWVASLAVLIESWSSGQMAPVVQYISKVVGIEDITKLLRKGRNSGMISKIIKTRHYMFHRDKRKYWDAGRFGPTGNLLYNTSLHKAFSKTLLAATKAANKSRNAK